MRKIDEISKLDAMGDQQEQPPERLTHKSVRFA
jgi:hypothetical protein